MTPRTVLDACWSSIDYFLLLMPVGDFIPPSFSTPFFADVFTISGLFSFRSPLVLVFIYAGALSYCPLFLSTSDQGKSWLGAAMDFFSFLFRGSFVFHSLLFLDKAYILRFFVFFASVIIILSKEMNFGVGVVRDIPIGFNYTIVYQKRRILRGTLETIRIYAYD